METVKEFVIYKISDELFMRAFNRECFGPASLMPDEVKFALALKTGRLMLNIKEMKDNDMAHIKMFYRGTDFTVKPVGIFRIEEDIRFSSDVFEDEQEMRDLIDFLIEPEEY